MAVKVNFQNGGRRHLGFSRKWNLTSAELAAARIYLRTKFGENILKGGRVMAVYLFSKIPRPPCWIYFRCRFFSYRHFYIVAVPIRRRSLWWWVTTFAVVNIPVEQLILPPGECLSNDNAHWSCGEVSIPHKVILSFSHKSTLYAQRFHTRPFFDNSP